MTIAYWCVLAAAVIPLIAIGIAKAGGERYNNRHPRVWLEKQQGYRARAAAAESNSFEAFPFFAAAVIIAHLAGAEQPTIDALAVGFLIARVVYGVLYIAGIARLRSVVWALGFFATIALFVVAA